MLKHVRAGDSEGVVGVKVVEDVLVREGQPGFLQEDDTGAEVAEEMTEIVLVSVKTF